MPSQVCITNCTKYHIFEQLIYKKMDTNKVVDSILVEIRTEIKEWVQEEPNFTCPIAYEQKLLTVAMSIAKTMVLQSQGKEPKGRNLKKK